MFQEIFIVNSDCLLIKPFKNELLIQFSSIIVAMFVQCYSKQSFCPLGSDFKDPFLVIITHRTFGVFLATLQAGTHVSVSLPNLWIKNWREEARRMFKRSGSWWMEMGRNLNTVSLKTDPSFWILVQIVYVLRPSLIRTHSSPPSNNMREFEFFPVCFSTKKGALHLTLSRSALNFCWSSFVSIFPGLLWSRYTVRGQGSTRRIRSLT